MALTDTFLRKIHITGKVYEKADRDGLSIRVSPKGKITFQYRYRFDGAACRARYGNYPDTSLAEARERHREARQLLDRNINPIAHWRELEAIRRQADTVEDLCLEWLNNYAYRHRRRPDTPERTIKVDVIPQIGQLTLDSLNRRIISREVLQPIVDRGSPTQANETLTLIKQIFQYGVEHGYMEFSPCAGMSKKNVGGEQKSRDRYLNDNEIAVVWHQLDTAVASKPISLAIKLLLLTGQRRGEINKANWRDISFAERLWKIPAENAKNGREHRVWLSDCALELFVGLRELSFGSEWVLSSPQKPDLPITERVITRAVARGQDDFGIAKWTPHDLRRTVATKMNELGVAPHVVEKILNHQMEGVMATYNRHDYWEESIAAWQLWSERLFSICICSNGQ